MSYIALWINVKARRILKDAPDNLSTFKNRTWFVDIRTIGGFSVAWNNRRLISMVETNSSARIIRNLVHSYS
jgi:hypothetical protein